MKDIEERIIPIDGMVEIYDGDELLLTAYECEMVLMIENIEITQYGDRYKKYVQGHRSGEILLRNIEHKISERETLIRWGEKELIANIASFRGFLKINHSNDFGIKKTWWSFDVASPIEKGLLG